MSFAGDTDFEGIPVAAVYVTICHRQLTPECRGAFVRVRDTHRRHQTFQRTIQEQIIVLKNETIGQNSVGHTSDRRLTCDLQMPGRRR